MIGPRRAVVAAWAFTILGVAPVAGQQAIPAQEYAARRAALMAALPDGITLLKARTAEKAMEEWGFVQDPSFLYFTGLAETPGAILAVDGPSGESWLFVPPPPASFGLAVESAGVAAGTETATRLGVDAVVPWEQFTAWVEGRLRDGVGTLYVDGSRMPEATGVPDGMFPVAGNRTLWRTTVQEAFPSATVASAKETIQRLRWVKSISEIGILRENARATVGALEAVAAALRPGMRQREAELVVASACVAAGAQGPSFWPWTMAGSNARVERLVESFFRYEHLDRTIAQGDLVRVDIGCAGRHYGADVGRTLPASGEFSPGQRESWDLLIAGYRAGLDAMRAGVAVDEVRQAARDGVARRAPMVETAQGRAAARAILDGGDAVWHLHGVGIESGEEALPVLDLGAVVAFEPGFEVDGDAFYLEDMILITATGIEILSAPLPMDAVGIESLMAR